MMNPQLIPPSLFPPEIRVILYLYLFPTLVVLGLIAIFLAWKLLVPKPAKEIFWNKISKHTFLQIFTTDGYAELKRGRVYAEGVAETKKKDVYLFPRPMVEKSDNVNTKRLEAEKMSLKRYALRGTGGMIWVAYAAKAIVTNVLTLLGLEKTKEKITIKAEGKMIERLKKLPAAKKKEAIKKLIALYEAIGDTIELEVLLPVDPAIIKKYFTPMFNQSQIKAYGNRREAIGEKKAAKNPMKILILVAILVAFGIACMVVIQVL